MSEPMSDLVPRDYHAVIMKVASLKDVDIDKLTQLTKLQEDWDKRRAAEHYNEAMSLAQGEMTQISKDAVNPQTRSQYATLGKLDAAIRPIYTKHGFSIEFDEETGGETGSLVVAYISCGAETRKRKKWVPVVTKGFQGKENMTLTHASMAAMTYARRTLLKMIFSLAEEDDDGNLAGGKLPPSETRRLSETHANNKPRERGPFASGEGPMTVEEAIEEEKRERGYKPRAYADRRNPPEPPATEDWEKRFGKQEPGEDG